MKATIDETGILRISPENALESFALRQWWNGWDKSTGTRKTSTLDIELSHEAPTNETGNARPGGE
ncbi:MAG: hypothetical protein ACYC1K_03440 [Minisyncoccota bacterium]